MPKGYTFGKMERFTCHLCGQEVCKHFYDKHFGSARCLKRRNQKIFRDPLNQISFTMLLPGTNYVPPSVPTPSGLNAQPRCDEDTLS